MKLQNLFLIGSLLVLASCAHHRDVRPGTNGLNNVIIQTDDKEAGARDAIAQANHFCEQYGKMAAFENEEQKYTGDMDEKTYKTGKTISKAAKTIGGTVWALGGQNESNAGGIVGLGGAVGDEAFGKGYTVKMQFRCQ
jgi:hypothetical protein